MTPGVSGSSPADGIQRTVQEVRAGPTYSSNIEDQDVDVTTIPPPIPKPGPAGLDTTGKEFVFFDLETKGLEHTSHIIQIAAVHSTGQKIPLQASEITGVTVVSDSMLVKRQTAMLGGVRDVAPSSIARLFIVGSGTTYMYPVFS
ncbi:hypothetical protein DPMN_100971 [Dreissena polymorpha]|uniref:Exonuclease domain-containing protein n=1 Tax=Dreissena polymorpha TaxID=45954 RepID=A0A9D4LIJ6_DREPO|nr:hypothetical protein DPMN_100971 [Dreissena polymorpha]